MDFDIFAFYAGDGSIDENEFCAVCDHYGISRQESSAAFQKFSKVGSAFKSKKYVLGATQKAHSFITHLIWRGEKEKVQKKIQIRNGID